MYIMSIFLMFKGLIHYSLILTQLKKKKKIHYQFPVKSNLKQSIDNRLKKYSSTAARSITR